LKEKEKVLRAANGLIARKKLPVLQDIPKEVLQEEGL
jgi:hypothetical protein